MQTCLNTTVNVLRLTEGRGSSYCESLRGGGGSPIFYNGNGVVAGAQPITLSPITITLCTMRRLTHLVLLVLTLGGPEFFTPKRAECVN